jgi:hypothetical protein
MEFRMKKFIVLVSILTLLSACQTTTTTQQQSATAVQTPSDTQWLLVMESKCTDETPLGKITTLQAVAQNSNGVLRPRYRMQGEPVYDYPVVALFVGEELKGNFVQGVENCEAFRRLLLLYP